MASIAEKKQQDALSAARIRDNQRRSRARRRELIDELKARVREYERQGVQATLEMREAARRVALENSRLRSLLASHGVTSEQVDRYLASFNDQPLGCSPTMAVSPPSDKLPPLHQAIPGNQDRRTPCNPRPPDARCSAAPVMAPSQQTPRPACTSQPFPADNTTAIPSPASDYYSSSTPTTTTPTSALDTLAVVADASSRQTCCGPKTQCTPADERAVTTQGHAPPTPEPSSRGCCGPKTQCTPANGPAVTATAQCHAPPKPEPASLGCCGGGGTTCSPSSPQPPRLDSDSNNTPPPTSTSMGASHMEMSCTAAAQIMASICRDSNEEKAREAMGCSGPGECFVKTTVVFDLLDSEGAV